MRTSSLLRSAALFGAASLMLVTATGCRIEAHTQSQFEDNTQPAKTSTKAWAGEAISIQNDGINPLGGLGGVEVKFSSTATTISVEAVFAAHADDDKKTDADAAIRDAIGTLTIDESNGFTIKCGHGSAHGSASVAGSGCKVLRVTIPTGTATMAHSLTVGDGNGSIRIGLADGGDAPFIKSLLVDNNGLDEVSVRIRPVTGASVTVTGEAAVQVAVPQDFSASKVSLSVAETDATLAAARVRTSDFPGFVNGSAYPSTGASATAATELSITSKGPFDDDTVSLVKF